MPEGHVYILGSTSGTLYTGVTSDFDVRIFQHRNGIKSNFASKYHCNRLLLHERFVDIRSAIAREKEIKGWTRTKKLALITQSNPEFKDLGVQLGWQMLHPQQKMTDQFCPHISPTLPSIDRIVLTATNQSTRTAKGTH